MTLEHRDESFLSLGPHGFHRIAYTDWGGPREQHVVVCVHGMTRNSRDFDMLAADLASECRVVCMDVVGRGESDWLEDPRDYGFPVYLNDAATLIAVLSQTQPAQPLAQFIQRLTGGNHLPFIDWVGTSMGGLIGMMLASKPNSPIRRLVLNDIGPFVPWQAFADLKSMHSGKGARFRDLDDVEVFLRSACEDFGPLSDAQWKDVARHSAVAIQGGGYALAWDPAIVSLAGAKQEGVEFGSGFLYGVDLWPTWNAVRCPTLVLHAEESTVLSAAIAERMRNSGPKAQIVEIPGVGHAPWLMSADQIGIVRDFLFAPDAPASE
jgi:pimeloyl-ACP methyl ester carboxylesterase